MDDITVGMIGAGGIADQHLPSWLELGVEVVIWSIDDNAPVLVSEHGGGRVAGSLEELLEEADIVDVCTPTFTHRELVERAAAAGRDVICEKPLGLSVADARAMAEACRAAGVRLLPGHIVRYFPEYAPLHDEIAKGRIGEVAVQRFVRIGARPEKEWFRDPALSGGIILDQMIHDIDFARWTAGAVVEVFARGIDGAGADVTTAQVMLTHAGGAITSIYGAWASDGTVFRTQHAIAGSAGYVQHDSGERSPLKLDVPAAGSERGGLLPRTAFNENPFVTELRDFLRAIRGGTPARVSAEDGIAAIAIAAAANESIRTGAAVAVDGGEIEGEAA
ncbi:MAG: Gfo/Idh/MocA family protein [Microbacterium sp.]